MNTLTFALADTADKMMVEFPNIFGGTEITYKRGFDIFNITIYWYGVLIAIGVMLAVIYAMRRCTRDFGLVKDRVFDVAFVTIIGGFLFARIYYCVFTEMKHPGSYNFVTTFTQIRDGGIAIYGGIIGAVVVGLLMCKFRKVNFFAMADLSSIGFLIGQTIGRWGNFINQEAYGAECDKNWLFAMTGNRISEEMQGAWVHPCFLYESVWCLLGFIFLHIYSKKLRTYDGEISLLYLAWYGFGRFFIEQLRTDSLYLGSFKVSQWLGALSFVAAIACFVIFKIRAKKSGRPMYVDSDASRRLIENDLAAELERKLKKEKKAESILADSETDEDDASEEEADDTDDDETDDDETDDDEIKDDEINDESGDNTADSDDKEDKESEDGSEDN